MGKAPPPDPRCFVHAGTPTVKKKVKRKKPVRITYVYAIRYQNVVKFGRSDRPRRRLSDVQNGFPFQLELVATIRAEETLEKRIHTGLHAERIRRRGEWFRVTERVTLLIELMNKGNVERVIEALQPPKSPPAGNRLRAIFRGE